MKMSRKENLHLSSQYNKLQESYTQLESLKESRSEVTPSLDVKDSSVSELESAESELSRLRGECDQRGQEVLGLQRQVEDMAHSYTRLQAKSRWVSLMSSIPLLILLFAVLQALYPTLEAIAGGLS